MLKQRKSPPPVLLYKLFNFSSTSLSKTRDRLLYRPPILFSPATAQKSNNTTKEVDKNFSYTSTDETKKEQNKLSAKMADELYDEFEDTEENDIMTDNEDSVEVERDDSLVENLEVEKDMFVEK